MSSPSSPDADGAAAAGVARDPPRSRRRASPATCSSRRWSTRCPALARAGARRARGGAAGGRARRRRSASDERRAARAPLRPRAGAGSAAAPQREVPRRTFRRTAGRGRAGTTAPRRPAHGGSRIRSCAAARDAPLSADARARARAARAARPRPRPASHGMRDRRRAFPRARRLGFAARRRRGRLHRRARSTARTGPRRRCRSAAAPCATAHGLLPVPAPATSALLDRLSVARRRHRRRARDADRRRDPAPPRRPPAPAARRRDGGRLLAHRHAAPARARCPACRTSLRALVFERSDGADRRRRASPCVEFDVDDMTGEEIALAADRLRATPGVIDVSVGTRAGKKGRPLADFRVLAQPARGRRRRARVLHRDVDARRCACARSAGACCAAREVAAAVDGDARSRQGRRAARRRAHREGRARRRRRRRRGSRARRRARAAARARAPWARATNERRTGRDAVLARARRRARPPRRGSPSRSAAASTR